jgi:deoxyribonuclease-4
MLPHGRRLGAHLPLSSGMLKAIDRAVSIRADALQIFTDNPTAWRRRRHPPRELDAFRTQLALRDIRPVSIHASYLINLPGPDDATYERSINLLTAELVGAAAYGARFVNVHIGSHRRSGVEAGIERLVAGIETVFARVEDAAREAGSDDEDPVASEPGARDPGVRDRSAADPGASDAGIGDPGAGDPDRGRRESATLVLENSAGGGGGLGTSVDELAAIADRLASRGIGRDQVAFCLDTAHAWGAGIDVGDPSTIDAFLAKFDDRIGLDRVALIHLNDTRSALGSRTDRHEHLGAGRIGPTGLGHVLRHPGLAHAPAIIETPGMDVGYDKVNMERARALAIGKPLTRLPSKAFELVGSARSRTART